MTEHFKRIILYARQYRANHEIGETLQRLLTYLNAQGLAVYQDSETAAGFQLSAPLLAREEMGKSGDLIVVVGGDGSILSASRLAIQVNTPVIGVNRGRLGFLTDILPQDSETQLGKILKGQYKEEKRFLLHARIYEKKTTFFESDALNDVVLSRGSETHLASFDVFVDGQLVSHFLSDGLILSTPTGSTAYALSAGGPIMHPKLNAIVLVPMFSHSLSARPLVIDGQSQILLHINKSNESAMRISCDAQESQRVKPGNYVSIEKTTEPLRLLHPLDYHYYDTLRSKLGWGSNNQG